MTTIVEGEALTHGVSLTDAAASKAKALLGWEPKTSFEQLIRLMVRADLDLLSR